jgi:hypothetical protein
MLVRTLLAAGHGPARVGLGLLLLAFAAPACSPTAASTHAATPPLTPNAATAPQQPTTIATVGGPSDALAAPPTPSPTEPATPPPASIVLGDSTPATPAPSPPGPVVVNLADELPFAATGSGMAKGHDAKPTKTTRPKKIPPGTTGQRSTQHGRKRGSRPYHPDPGIIVDVTSVGAGANQADVQRLARAKGYTPFRHCYEEGLRRNQKIGGKVSLDLVLAADGSVQSAVKTASTVGDSSVDQCVAREAGHLALARPDSGTPNVAMVVTLSPGDETVAVPHAAPHADKLRDALRTRWSGVEVCYKQGLEKHRDLGGRLEVKFKVKPNGDIVEVAEGDTHFTDGDVSKCVVGVFKGAKLPKLGGKHDATFVYAMHMEAIPAVAPPTVASTTPATTTPAATP